MGIEAFLKKVAQAKASGGGNYILDGRYVFAVKNVLLRNGHRGDSFIVEFIVQDAKPASYEVDGKVPAHNPVNSECSFIANLSKESAAGNIKAFTLALLGYKEEEVSAEDFETTLGDLLNKDNPARGMVIGCTTFRKETKEKKWITLPSWTTLENSPEATAARRALIDQAKPISASAQA